jgi:hypothetical protein
MHPVPTRRLDNWSGRDAHIGIGPGHFYLISCAPYHVCSCTYITKVNRNHTKRAEMLLGKGLLAVPISPYLKEEARVI